MAVCVHRVGRPNGFASIDQVKSSLHRILTDVRVCLHPLRAGSGWARSFCRQRRTPLPGFDGLGFILSTAAALCYRPSRIRLRSQMTVVAVSKLYVSNAKDTTVSVLDMPSLTVVQTIPDIGLEPFGLDFGR